MSATRSFHGSVIKLVIFAAVSFVVTTVVIATLLDLDTSGTRGYKAIFANANGLQAGDIVAVAGVEVGKVEDVALSGRVARVTFTVDATQDVTTRTEASVGFENLLGNRYLALSEPSGGGPRLPSGSTIPESRTNEGLDLTDLFDGFQPLFAALTPNEVNQLTASIIQVFQGQSDTLSGLLTQTAALTDNLADRGQVIDEVIDNLTPLLQSVGGDSRQLGSLINGLTGFTSGLASERGEISSAIAGVGDLTKQLSHVFSQTQPEISGDIKGLSTASATLAHDQGDLGAALRNLTPFISTLTKVSDSGNYLSVYICNLTIHTSGTVSLSLVPGVTGTLALPAGAVGDPADHTANCR